jgi:hypothetical protein
MSEALKSVRWMEKLMFAGGGSVTTLLVVAACATTTASDNRTAGDASPAVLTNFHNGCEPDLPFSRYRSQIFVASDAQLNDLIECGYLGLARDGRTGVAPGSCTLTDHTRYAIQIPAFQAGTLQHLGHVLGSPVVDLNPPATDSAAWPPLTLLHEGSSNEPSGNLWRFTDQYLDLLRKARADGREAAVGDALAAHLLEFNKKLRAYIPNQACRSLVGALADLATQASSQDAHLYVLTLASGI